MDMTARKAPDANSDSVASDAVRSDALVVYGATGDLAHKMIFPALYELVRQGVLNIPVIGVAHSKANLAQLQERAEDGIRQTAPSVDGRVLRRLLAIPERQAKQASQRSERPAAAAGIP
jgi:glucose-6-phosphate 1-dehydrogenase